MVAMNAQKVDAYFGIGTFADYLLFKRQLAQLTAHYEKRLKNAFGGNDGGLSFRIDSASYIEASIETAFEKVSDGTRISKAQFTKVFDLYQIGVDVAQMESDYLDAVFAAGFLPMLRNLVKQFPTRDLKKAADEERRALKALEEALDHAKTQRIQAFQDKLFDIAQLVIPVVGQVKIVHEAAMSLGGLAADALLGPEGPSDSKVARTAGTTTAGVLTTVSNVSSGVQKFVKVGGALNSAYDVVDFDELKKSFDNVDKIRDAIDLEKKWRKYIVETIWANWAQRVISLENQLKKVRKNLDDSRQEVRDAVVEFDKIYASSGYKRYLIWDIER
jgi:hypothetical protein